MGDGTLNLEKDSLVIEGWPCQKTPSLSGLFMKKSYELKNETALWGVGLGSIEERVMTWGAWRAFALELAAGWIKSGLKEGEPVIVDLPQTIEWPLVHMSILLAGGVTVPLIGAGDGWVGTGDCYESFKQPFDEIGARFVVTGWSVGMQELVRRRPSDMGRVEKIYYIEGSLESGMLSIPDLWTRHSFRLASLRESGKSQLEFYPDSVVRREHGKRGEDAFMVLFTPGTEGKSRGVVLNQENLFSSCDGVAKRLSLAPHNGDRQLIIMPNHTIWGVDALWLGIMLGQKMKLMSSSTLEPGTLDDWPIALLFGTPQVFEAVMDLTCHAGIARSLVAEKLSKWAKEQLSERKKSALFHRVPRGVAAGVMRRQLKRIFGSKDTRLVCAGLPPGEDLESTFNEAGFPLQNGYGLTEASGFTNLKSWRGGSSGTAGEPIEGSQVKLSPEGEIMVRGPIVFNGYWRNDPPIDLVINEEGFFKTGDVGILEDGGLLVLDRKHHIFETGNGHPVAPLTIERELESNKEIRHAVVVGTGRPYLTVLLELEKNIFQDLLRDKKLEGKPENRRKGSRKGANGDSAHSLSWAAPDLWPKIQKRVRRVLDNTNSKLTKVERIRAFQIVDSIMPRGEEAGALGRPKRDIVLNAHSKLIDDLYLQKPTLR